CTRILRRNFDYW
nr:immunoglobulin heavy chain junction region [Mus musculus]